MRRTVSLGAELKRWRNRRGLSYRGLAHRVACEHSHLWKIEHGKAALTREMAEACDRALDAGGALIAAWVAAQGSVRPAQLPVAPVHVVGRDAELAALGAAVSGRPLGVPAVVAIDGPAGVGKTALALRWAHEIAVTYVDGQLYVDLGGFAPPGHALTADVVLERFLAAAGASSIPATVAERATLYRSLLAERKVLVVLDNAGDAGVVEHLLPASAGCTVVVTSRRALSGLVAHVGATRVTLGPLAEPDSIALISRIIGPARARAEAAAVARLAGLCGHVPLALRAAGEHVATYPLRRVADLVDGHSGVDLLDCLDIRRELSWSYRDLEPDAARLFGLLGLHRGPHLRVVAVAALAGHTRAEARRLLHRLASIHLVEIDSDDVVRPHHLTRAYARELAALPDDEDDRSAAIQRLVSWYAATVRAVRVQLVPESAALAEPEPPATGIHPLSVTGDTEAAAWCRREQDNVGPILALAREQGLSAAADSLAADVQALGLLDDAVDIVGDPQLGASCLPVPRPRSADGGRQESESEPASSMCDCGPERPLV